MSVKQPLEVDYGDWQKILPNPPLLTSFQSGWSNIQLAYYRHPSLDLPEISSSQHVIVIPLKYQAVDLEYCWEGRLQKFFYREQDIANGCIQFVPANLPVKSRSHTSAQGMELIHCHLDPAFVATIAHESINPDRVELLQIMKKADLLLHQLGLALKSSLEEDGSDSRFYADAMATAMAAHLLRHYATRNHHFQQYEDGLSKQKLRQAIDYMQAHLDESLSLSAIANELGMSQYYFCHLFKRSTGMSPHQYLMRQRVERARHLLKQPEQTIISVAMDCGFANPSHFAKCFRQHTGMNPKQFRNL